MSVSLHYEMLWPIKIFSNGHNHKNVFPWDLYSYFLHNNFLSVQFSTFGDFRVSRPTFPLKSAYFCIPCHFDEKTVCDSSMLNVEIFFLTFALKQRHSCHCTREFLDLLVSESARFVDLTGRLKPSSIQAAQIFFDRRAEAMGKKGEASKSTFSVYSYLLFVIFHSVPAKLCTELPSPRDAGQVSSDSAGHCWSCWWLESVSSTWLTWVSGR